jgi:hypothetical protein
VSGSVSIHEFLPRRVTSTTLASQFCPKVLAAKNSPVLEAVALIEMYNPLRNLEIKALGGAPSAAFAPPKQLANVAVVPFNWLVGLGQRIDRASQHRGGQQSQNCLCHHRQIPSSAQRNFRTGCRPNFRYEMHLLPCDTKRVCELSAQRGG